MTGGAAEPATKDAAEGPRWDRHPGEPRAPFFLISNLNPFTLNFRTRQHAVSQRVGVSSRWLSQC